MKKSGGVQDLVYIGPSEEYLKDIRNKISTRFPNAILSDSYDDIHEWRVGVSIPDAVQDDWYEFAMTLGIHNLCFVLGLDAIFHPERINTIAMKVLDAQKGA